MNDHRELQRNGVRSGVPGAGWFITAVFVFSVVALAGWEQGWWDTGRNTAAALSASHRMTTGADSGTQPTRP